MLAIASSALLSLVDDLGGRALRRRVTGYRNGVARRVEAVDATARYAVGRLWAAWVVYWKLFCVCMVLLCIFWSMVVGSVLVGATASAGSYVFLIPEQQGAALPFSFNYNSNPPEAMIPIQSYLQETAWGGAGARVPRESRIQAVAYPFSSDSHYNFTVRMSIPETPHNMRLGVFTVDVGVWGWAGGDDVVELSRLSRSAALQAPQSDITRQVSELLLLPVSLTSGGSAPTQLLHLNMNSLWQPFANENISHLSITMNPSVHVHTSQLLVEEGRAGVAGFIQRHPYLFTLAIFLVIGGGTFVTLSFWCIVVALLAFVWIAKRQSETHDTHAHRAKAKPTAVAYEYGGVPPSKHGGVHPHPDEGRGLSSTAPRKAAPAAAKRPHRNSKGRGNGSPFDDVPLDRSTSTISARMMNDAAAVRQHSSRSGPVLARCSDDGGGGGSESELSAFSDCLESDDDGHRSGDAHAGAEDEREEERDYGESKRGARTSAHPYHSSGRAAGARKLRKRL